MADYSTSSDESSTDYTPFVFHLESLTQIAESMGHHVLAARVQSALDELQFVLGDN